MFSIPETQGRVGGSYVVSDAYAQLIVRFLLSHSVEQVANVVLYSSDYYTKVVAAEEAQWVNVLIIPSCSFTCF